MHLLIHNQKAQIIEEQKETGKVLVGYVARENPLRYSGFEWLEQHQLIEEMYGTQSNGS